MDSLTQIVLGASVAAVTVPAPHRRAALIVGALLGTLPDLDVLPLAFIDDPVARMTWHRSVSHSLLVLLPFGLLLWWWLRRVWSPVRDAPRPWLAAIALALGTHPLLDAHTVYGTQLFWPLPLAPTMWSTVFIVDPLYTVPLLIGVLVGWFARVPATARRWLLAGVLLSTAYLAWTWIAKVLVDRQFDTALASAGHGDAPRFSVPMPFTSFVWCAVAMTPDGYVEATTLPWRSALTLRRHRVDAEARAWALANSPSAQRLDWFASGFVRMAEEDGSLVVTDLRMGMEPMYFFRFAVATRDGDGWRTTPPLQLPSDRPGWEQLREAWRVP